MNYEAIRNLLDDAYDHINDSAWLERFNTFTQTTPANENLSSSARALLSTLYNLQGRKILTGQHEYIEVPEWTAGELFKRVQRYSVVKGVEFGGISGQNEATLEKQRKAVVESCKSHAKWGGIITGTYHAPYPNSPQTWDMVQRKTTQAEFDQIVTVGTKMHAALLVDIDKVASHLKVLCNANIPVLWRPYHEMNGGWFWWGAKKNFATLWNIMYDRFVNYHQLNNLIWVWCPNAENQWCGKVEDYYVGAAKTDVLALDIYSKDFKQSHYDKLLKMAKGKLIAIGENGELPDAKTLAAQPKYSWMLTWAKMLWENNSDATIKAFYASDFALKLGDKLDLPAAPVQAAPAVKMVNGLTGQYFKGVNFDELKLTRIDDTVNFDWKGGKPIAELATDNFSVRWIGHIESRYSEEYKFSLNSDDGARLLIDGAVVAEKWKNGAGGCSGKLNMVAGKKYPITLEFYEATGNAMVTCSWSSKSQTSEVLPNSQLTTNEI